MSDPLLEKLTGVMQKLADRKEYTDDRTYIFSKVFAAVPKLPEGSVLGKQINDVLIKTLYESLPHPPTSMMQGDRFRTADGSRNNVHMPQLGQAGTAYARNVQGSHPLPPHSLPDPGLVYDELLRTRTREDHPGKNSSMTFAFASLVTHSLFRTDSRDWGQNSTSSYLDLSPLYGSNQAEQDTVRNKDGRGLLHPDTFAEGRLVFLPPASGALLVIWNRNHNFIATNILKINEQRRWKDPSLLDDNARAAQDEEIFQTARLINCASFMSVIFGDYVAGFLGTTRYGSAWSMQPFGPIEDLHGRKIGRGEGNHVSVEFNLLYRWHATMSAEDEKWTLGLFQKLFGDIPPAELTLPDLYKALGELREGKAHPDVLVHPDPRQRNFGGIKRGPDGRFADGDLARILHNATESVAGRYGARGTPEVIKIIEIMAMEQARKWGVCTMNEFRKYMGLKPFANFTEWNRDPVIAKAAERLYGNIENLELYPGLHAEETMVLGPGSGLCAGFTVTRGILSDAIALVRGDRFFTTDFTPTNLTCWGFHDVQRNPENGAYGAYLPKLLMRTLPRHYTYNSVYGLFPFFIPPVSKTNLEDIEKKDPRVGKLVEKYDFKRPVEQPIPKILNNFTAINYVFSDINKFKVPYGPDMRYLTNDKGMFLIFDENPKHDQDRAMALHALFPNNDSLKEHVTWYRGAVKGLIKARSVQYDSVKGKTIDIIRDCINPAAVRWVCESICGLSLKSDKNPGAPYTEDDVYPKLATLFSCVFRNTEPHNGWGLRTEARKYADEINAVIKANLERASLAPKTMIGQGLLNVAQRVDQRLTGDEANKASEPFHKRLVASKKTIDELTGTVLGLAVGSSVNYAQAVAQVVDFYMDDSQKEAREHIVQLVGKDDAESQALLVGYYREGARLNPQFPALLRVSAVQDSIPQSGGKPAIEVKPGDRLFCSFKNAHLDPELFPEPTKVNPSRPRENYRHHAAGTHICPGLDFSEQTIPGIMREIFGLKNLRRAKGDKGILQRITNNVAGTEMKTYIADSGDLSPWPESLLLVYDE